jgi:hypothetical protein
MGYDEWSGSGYVKGHVFDAKIKVSILVTEIPFA